MHFEKMKNHVSTALIAALVASPFTAAMAQSDQTQTDQGNDSLPNVVVMATGGTIAGSSESNTDTTDYESGSLGVDALVSAVPELADVANVTSEQVVNVSSPDMTADILLQLSKTVNERLSDDSISGVVITHGTSTAEETATFLDMTVDSEKPIVVVGAMRPATAISADGPFNLLQAVSLAGSEKARGRGAMIALNDRIGSAIYTTKTNTLSLDTFKAVEQGYLGVFVGTEPHFFYEPAQVTGMPHFDVSDIEDLPKVDILYGYQDQDPALLDAAVENGAEGLVVAVTGNSSVADPVAEKIDELMAKGIPVIRASHVGSGYVSPRTEGIAAGFYNPQKARILLMLAMAAGDDTETIRGYFTGN